MDDIARDLSISKKTIYQYFRDKNDLVLQVTRDHLEKEKLEIRAIKESTSNAIETLIEESLCLRKNITGMNPSLLFDLKKYHQQAWELYLDCKQTVYISSLKETLEKGVEEGYFRQEIDPRILAVLRVEQIQMSLERFTYPRDQFEFKEVQIQLFDHFLHGLVSEKGRKLLNKYKKDHVETLK
ncbi:MAG: TetR family transcriptional regulator [Cyclobacteriaceae bacterium]|nr:MAG: TetR family transcriptional regulator [Cyclobacteriaceae bacterium]